MNRQLTAWPGQSTKPPYAEMLHLLDDHGTLCGAITYSVSAPVTFAFEGINICPLCDRLRDYPSSTSCPPDAAEAK